MRPCWWWFLVMVFGFAQAHAQVTVDSTTPPTSFTRVVQVGLLADFAPLQFWPDGQSPTGYDVDYLRKLEPRLNLRFEFKRFERFDDLLAALRRGEVQVTPSTAQTSQRAATMRFTRPYVSVQQAFVGRRDLTSVPSTPDLAGRRLALVRGFVSESIAQERFPTASTPVYDTLTDAMQALRTGEADFVFDALPVARALVDGPLGKGFAVLRTYGFPEGHLRFAVRLQEAELRDRLDAAVRDTPAAELAVLRERWLTSPPLPPEPLPGDASNARPLRIAYFPGDRPYSQRSRDGDAEGIGIELTKAVLKRAGLDAGSFEPMELPQMLKALGEGRVDLALGLTDTAERRSRMAFVGPYRANPLVIVSRQQYSIWELHQLSGRRLAMLEGFFGASYIRAQFPTVEIVECPNFNACLDRVEEGGADAALYGLQGAYERLNARASRDLQITGVVASLFDEQNFGLSLEKLHLAPRLRVALDQALKEDLPGIERAWAEYTASKISRDRVAQALVITGVGFAVLLLAAWLHLRRLRREITLTRDAKAQADQARSEAEGYLAFLAHEVRNSLQSVSGAVDLLRAPAAATVDRQVLLPALGRSARATLGLLNGILDRHRLQGPGLRLVLADARLAEVVGDVVDDMRPAAEAKGLHLNAVVDTEAPMLRVDALRVQQILRNLVINAVKFSDAGTIEVRGSATPVADGAGQHRVELVVSDQGPGIAQADQQRIFDRYVTVGGDRPGAGLGLAFCRDLAGAMNGSLEVHSDPGAGAAFTLRFSADVAAVAVPVAAGASPTLARQILVLEDSPVYSLLLHQAFRRAGLAALMCESLAEARQLLLEEPALDLLLLDVNLPDGHISELLADPAWNPARPVIAMSADFDEAEMQRLRKLGVKACLPKDADIQAFVHQVLRESGLVRVQAA